MSENTVIHQLRAEVDSLESQLSQARAELDLIKREHEKAIQDCARIASENACHQIEAHKWKALAEKARAELEKAMQRDVDTQRLLWNSNADRDRFKAELEKLSCPHCGNDVNGNNWKSLALKAREFLCHDDSCILSQWSQGEPTPDGGYRTMYAGKWYRNSPVDETPKCDCGIDEVLSLFPPCRREGGWTVNDKDKRCKCGCKLRDHWFAGTSAEFCNGFCGTGCMKFIPAESRNGQAEETEVEK